MDPYKGSILQKIITFFLYIFLIISYLILKIIYLFKKKEQYIQPSHVIEAPDTPISSFKLAQALNPKTEPSKLTRFAQDEDPFVRKAVCRNPSLPKEMLIKLTTDSDPGVANEALIYLKNIKPIVEENFPTQHGA